MTMNNTTAIVSQFTPEQIQAGIEYFTGIIRDMEGRLEKGWQLYEAETNPARRERIYIKWLGYLHKYEEAYQHRRDLGFDPVAA